MYDPANPLIWALCGLIVLVVFLIALIIRFYCVPIPKNTLIGKDDALKVITVLNWPEKDACPPPYTPLPRRLDSECNSDCLDFSKK